MLQSSKILGDERVEQGYFGQEINPTTYNLARINVSLHDIAPDEFDTGRDETLPRREIELAKERRADYLRRRKENEDV